MEVEFRKKLWSASRALKINVRTSLSDSRLEIRIIERPRLSSREIEKFEKSVKSLKLKGQSNAEIADMLGIKDYNVEYIVRRLIRRGALSTTRERKKKIKDLREKAKAIVSSS